MAGLPTTASISIRLPTRSQRHPGQRCAAGADNAVTTNGTDYVFDCGLRVHRHQRQPVNALLAVKITTRTAGTLTDNGTAVTAGQFIVVADITAGLLS